MPQLDPQAQALLDAAKAAGLAPPYTLPVTEARQRMRAAFITSDPPLEIAEVKDMVIPGPCGGIELRSYRPDAAADAPACLFFHGGGWTVNDLDTHDHLCRRLASGSSTVVLSVNYRMSPEWKYPAAVEDAYVSYRWAIDNAASLGIHPSRIALVGDSSGGTIALVLALLLRDRGAPQAAAVVAGYLVARPLGETPSYDERGTGYSLNRDFMRWFLDNYLPEGVDAADPYLFPGGARSFANLPPAIILTAEFDPLRDEGREIAEKLVEAGVGTTHWHLDDQMHGFLMQDRTIDRARDTIDALASALRETLGVTATT